MEGFFTQGSVLLTTLHIKAYCKCLSMEPFSLTESVAPPAIWNIQWGYAVRFPNVCFIYGVNFSLSELLNYFHEPRTQFSISKELHAAKECLNVLYLADHDVLLLPDVCLITLQHKPNSYSVRKVNIINGYLNIGERDI